MNIQKIHQFDGHTGSIFTLEEGSDAHLFYSCGNDHLIVEWDLKNPNSHKAIAQLPSKAFAIKNILSKNLLLVGNYSGGIHVIDLLNKKEIKLLQVHTDIIFDIQYLEAKNQFFVLSADGSFSVWNSNDFSLIFRYKLSNLKLRTIVFHEKLNEAIIGCGDGSIRIIDLKNFQEKEKHQGHEKDFSVNTLKIHPNGIHLISGSRDGHINIWNIEKNYDLELKIPAHNYAIYSIVFNPSGTIMATGSMDKNIKIWDSQTMRVLKRIDRKEFEGHTNSVNKLLWLSYNDLLLSTGDDRTIKVWEITEK